MWTKTCTFIVVVTLACVLGCSSRTDFTRDMTVNNHRVIVQKRDGVTRTVKTQYPIRFRDGQPTQYPKGTVIHLTEECNGRAKQAELRETDGDLEWWVDSNAVWNPANAEESASWESFLQEMRLEDRDAQEVAQNAIYESWPRSGLRASLATLKSLSFSSNRADILAKLLDEKMLTPQDQSAIVQAIFEYTDFDSERKSLLLSLIGRRDSSSEAKTAVAENVDRLSFDSTKMAVLKALLNHSKDN